MPFLSGAYQIALRNLLVWRRYAAASAVGNFGEPVLYLLALGFGLGQIVEELGGMSYAEFIAPGLVVSTVMYTATFECTFGSYTRLETQGTYDAILATPITVGELIFGEVLFAGIKSMVGAAIVLIVIALFGLVPAWTSLLVLPTAFIAGLLFASMAMIVTSISKSYEFFNYYFTLVIAPMFLFSGVFFPLDRMPPWVEAAAQILPLTHVVEISRGVVRGHLDVELLIRLAVIVGGFAAAHGLCQLTLRRRMVR